MFPLELNIGSNHKFGGCRISSFEPNEVRFIGHEMKRQPLLVLKQVIRCRLPELKTITKVSWPRPCLDNGGFIR